MLQKKMLALKRETCHDSKQNLMLLLCVNMNGANKRGPLVVQKVVKSQCFKKTKELHVNYVSNSKA